MILKTIGSMVLNLRNKTDKGLKTAKERILDKQPAEENICSKNEADAIKAAFIGRQNATVDIAPDNTKKDDEYYIFDDEDDDISPEEESILHELRTVGYAKSLLHKLYFNGYDGEELSIDAIAGQQADEIIETYNKKEIEDFICNIKEGMERINEAASLMSQDIDEELIQKGYTLCGKIIHLLENK